MRLKDRKSLNRKTAKVRLLTSLLLVLILAAAPATMGETYARLPGEILPLGGISPQTLRFDGGQKHAVYSGPGEDSMRAASGKASISTRDWFLAYGKENGWVLIQYAIDENHMRFGWIPEEALPPSVEIGDLDFSPRTATLTKAAVITDDPLRSESPLVTLPRGTLVSHLADMGDWAYVESASGDFVRGFVRRDSIVLGSVYDLESCPAESGEHILSGTVVIGQDSLSAQIVPRVEADGQKLAVSGYSIYDNIAGKLLLTLSAAGSECVGRGMLDASTTSLRIVPILQDGREADTAWTVVLEW